MAVVAGAGVSYSSRLYMYMRRFKHSQENSPIALFPHLPQRRSLGTATTKGRTMRSLTSRLSAGNTSRATAQSPVGLRLEYLDCEKGWNSRFSVVKSKDNEAKYYTSREYFTGSQFSSTPKWRTKQAIYQARLRRSRHRSVIT